jgi:hypothetical protein
MVQRLGSCARKVREPQHPALTVWKAAEEKLARVHLDDTVIRQLTDSSSPDTEGLQRVIMLWSGPNESPLTQQLRNSK